MEEMSSSGGGGGVQLDSVLARLGACGRHQLLTAALLALVYATNSMYNVNYVFAVEDVQYRSVHHHHHAAVGLGGGREEPEGCC